MSAEELKPSVQALADALDETEELLRQERDANKALREQVQAVTDNFRALKSHKVNQLVRLLRVDILVYLSRILAPAFGQTISGAWDERVRELIANYQRDQARLRPHEFKGTGSHCEECGLLPGEEVHI